jgi:D-3-phosphoglycerate dehydrogenase
MAGTLSFDESLHRRLRLFQATKADIVELTAYLQTCVTPSLLTCIDWFRRNKEHIYVLSGGFEEYILPIITSLGLLPEYTYANRFTYDAAGRITGYDATRQTGQVGGKVTQVRALKLTHPLIVIGDGYTDYEIKAGGVADQFWAFTEHVARPEVIAHADRVLDSFNNLPTLAASLSAQAQTTTDPLQAGITP